MGLITKGYKQRRYYPANYYIDDYWHGSVKTYVLEILDGLKVGEASSSVGQILAAISDIIRAADAVGFDFTGGVASSVTAGYLNPSYWPKGYKIDDYWPDYIAPGVQVFISDGIKMSEPAIDSRLHYMMQIFDGITGKDSHAGVKQFQKILADGVDFGDIISTALEFIKTATDKIKVSDERLIENLLSNGGFENAGAGGADIFSGWTENAGSGAIADETTEVRTGSHACKLTAGAVPNNTYVYQTVNAKIGERFRFSFYTRGDGTNAGQYRVWDFDNTEEVIARTSTGITGTAYTKKTVTFLVKKTATLWAILYSPTTNGGISYFDDVRLEKITSPDVDITLGPLISDTIVLKEGRAETLTMQVGASADDGEYHAFDDVYEVVGETLRFGDYSGDSSDVCIRFDGVNIPKNAIITDAYLQFYIYTTAGTILSLTCRGVSQNDTGDYSSSPFSRPTTTASADFSRDQWPTEIQTLTWEDSPSVATIVQEIVNRAGWQSGNAMGFFILDDGNALNDNIQVRSYDGDTDLAPKLVVTYVEPTVNANVTTAALQLLDKFNWGDATLAEFIRAIIFFRRMGQGRFFVVSAPGAALSLTVADGAKFTEQVLPTLQALAQIADKIKLNDVMAFVLNLAFTAEDGIKTADVTELLRLFGASIADGTTWGDLATEILKVDASVADGINFAEALEAVLNVDAVVTDGLIFSELVEYVVGVYVRLVIVEGLKWGENLTAKLGIAKAISDRIKFSDAHWTGQLLTNGSFEVAGGGGADVFGTWTESAGLGSIEDEGSVVHSGTHACKLTGPSAGSTNLYQTVTTNAGERWRFSFYTRSDGVNAGRYRVYNETALEDIVALTSTNIPGTTYTKHTVYFTANKTCTMRIYLYSPNVNGGICYFDDVKLDRAQSPLLQPFQFLTTILDGADFSDAVVGAKEFQKVLNDGLVMGDVSSIITTFVTFFFTVLDGLKVADAAAGEATFETTLVDKAKWADSQSVVLQMQKLISDGATFGEVVSGLVLTILAVTDGTKWGDTVQRGIGMLFQATDGAKLGDTTPDPELIVNALLEDKINPGELLTALLTVTPVVVDGAVFADAITTITERLFQLLVSDGVKFSDTIVHALGVLVQAADGIKLAEQTSTDVTFEVTVVDNIKFAEVVSAVAQFALTITDGGKMGDVTTHTWVGESGFQAKISFTVKGRSLSFIVKGRDLDFIVKS